MARINPKIEKHTIGKYLIVFAKDAFEMEESGYYDNYEAQFHGLFIDLSISSMQEFCENIAEVHADYEKYYEASMVVLYKGYSKTLRKGTESAVLAIQSLRKNDDLKYVCIVRALK